MRDMALAKLKTFLLGALAALSITACEPTRVLDVEVVETSSVNGQDQRTEFRGEGQLLGAEEKKGVHWTAFAEIQSDDPTERRLLEIRFYENGGTLRYRTLSTKARSFQISGDFFSRNGPVRNRRGPWGLEFESNLMDTTMKTDVRLKLKYPGKLQRLTKSESD